MISYSSHDRKFVNEVMGRFQEGGITPWIDENISFGSIWSEDLIEQLKTCDVLVPVISEHFLESEFCKMEVFVAQSAGKRIVPIMHSRELQYENLREHLETKGIEDLYMFRITDQPVARAMSLEICRDEALRLTVEGSHRQKQIPNQLIYIAFAQSQVDLASSIAVEVQNINRRTWIATRDIAVGDNFMREQIDAMMHAKGVVLVLGEDVVENRFIVTELNLARAQGVPVLPVLPKQFGDSPDSRNKILYPLREHDHTLEVYFTNALVERGGKSELALEIDKALKDVIKRNPKRLAKLRSARKR